MKSLIVKLAALYREEARLLSRYALKLDQYACDKLTNDEFISATEEHTNLMNEMDKKQESLQIMLDSSEPLCPYCGCEYDYTLEKGRGVCPKCGYFVLVMTSKKKEIML